MRKSATTIVRVSVLLSVREKVVEGYIVSYKTPDVFGTDRTLYPHLVSKVSSLCSGRRM